MKDRLSDFLKQELKLELSSDKTAITHAFDGFEFLGFHVRKYKERKGVIIKPTEKNIQKIKSKLDRFTDRRNDIAVSAMILTLNPIIRGWANYYRFVNSYKTLSALDWYLARRFIKWYRGKHNMNLRQGTIRALKWIKGGEAFTLGRFSGVKVRRYKWKKIPNPYMGSRMELQSLCECPFTEIKWYGESERNLDLTYQCYRRDGGVCQICQRPKINLIAHHIIPLKDKGEDKLENLITICKDCEKKYYRKLHQEIRTKEEIEQLGESRVR